MYSVASTHNLLLSSGRWFDSGSEDSFCPLGRKCGRVRRASHLRLGIYVPTRGHTFAMRGGSWLLVARSRALSRFLENLRRWEIHFVDNDTFYIANGFNPNSKPSSETQHISRYFPFLSLLHKSFFSVCIIKRTSLLDGLQYMLV